MTVVVTTNHVPRFVIEAHELSESEQKDFDYLDWDAIHDGRDSATFFRYKGDLYSLDQFTRGGIQGWDGAMALTYSWGICVRYPKMFPEWPEKSEIDHERIIVGAWYDTGYTDDPREAAIPQDEFGICHKCGKPGATIADPCCGASDCEHLTDVAHFACLTPTQQRLELEAQDYDLP